MNKQSETLYAKFILYMYVLFRYQIIYMQFPHPVI